MINRINKILLFVLLALLPAVITEDKACEYLFSNVYLFMTGANLTFYFLRSKEYLQFNNNQ